MIETTLHRYQMAIVNECTEDTLQRQSGGHRPIMEGKANTSLRLSTVGCSACFPRPDYGSRWESSPAAGAVENT